MNATVAQPNPAKKRIRRYRNEAILVLLIILMGLGVFFFFKSFFEASPSNLAIEILAAFLGSIITVMITMLLLRQQGTFENAQETAATNKTAIFEKKLDLFRDFISYYVKFAADGKMEIVELAALEERALTISLLTTKIRLKDQDYNLGEKICRFVLQLQKNGINDRTDEQGIQFVDIMKLMKIELGVAQQADPDDVDDDDEKSDKYQEAHALLSYRDYRIE